MSEKVPRVTAAQMVKVLERIGFGLARQTGSHMIFKDATGLRATIPSHAGKILHPKVLKSIMHEADLSVDELRTLLK